MVFFFRMLKRTTNNQDMRKINPMFSLNPTKKPSLFKLERFPRKCDVNCQHFYETRLLVKVADFVGQSMRCLAGEHPY